MSLPPPLPDMGTSAQNRPVMTFLVREDGEDRYDLSAPYQRGSVWGEARQRDLIHSLLVGIPIGAIVLSNLPYKEGRDAWYRVIDGKQRIEAIRAWCANRFTVPGWWFPRGHLTLGEAAREDDVTWGDLTRSAQRYFENITLATAIFDGSVRFVRDLDTGKITDRIERNEEELLEAEAEVFRLINFAGLPQGETDV